MKQFDIRPDKILLSGIKSLTDFSLNLLEIKTEAKGRGEIAFVGEKKIDEVQTQLYEYDFDEVTTKEKLKDFEFFDDLKDKKTYWLNFHGLHEVEIIEQLAKTLSLDRMTVRQTLDTTLRPKVEEYDHYLFFSIKSILKNDKGQLDVEHLSFVLGKNYVISFQEKMGDHFDHLRNKILEKLGLLRKKGSDFLLYQLLDAILDNYFETIESINDEIQAIEKIVLTNPTQDSLVKLEQLKQMAELVKKSLNPFKEALRVLQNRKTVFIGEGNSKYFHDLTNSCLSAIEEIESTAKSLEGLTNIYFSSLSQKMNETMKVLTTVATIFIPLTFIAGVYGMNFENMPELGYKYGYFITWGVMGLVFIGMVIYFKRKKWL
ncbi:MAG: magnesium/cobalt transporter CorA [Cyclobacteriaceae bacterium]